VLPELPGTIFQCPGAGLPIGPGVFAGEPRPGEMIKTVETLDHAQLTQGKNLHLFETACILHPNRLTALVEDLGPGGVDR
jgi:hypothetical protein